MKQVLIWLPFVGLVLLAVMLVQRLIVPHDMMQVATPLVGKPMPPLDLPNYASGQPNLTNVILGSHPLILNFFASWCGPCAAEHPVLRRLAAARQIELDGVAVKDQPVALADYLARRGNPYAMLAMGNDPKLAIDWGLTGVPETFAIDSGGTIRGHHLGPLSDADARNLVRLAKGDKP